MRDQDRRRKPPARAILADPKAHPQARRTTAMRNTMAVRAITLAVVYPGLLRDI